MPNSTETRLALAEQAIVEIKVTVDKSDKRQEEIHKKFLDYVSQHEFKPVKTAYYAIMAAILTGLTSAFFVKVLGVAS